MSTDPYSISESNIHACMFVMNFLSNNIFINLLVGRLGSFVVVLISRCSNITQILICILIIIMIMIMILIIIIIY